MARDKLLVLLIISLILIGGGLALREWGKNNEPALSVEDQIAEVTRQIESGRITAEEGSRRLCAITARREEER